MLFLLFSFMVFLRWRGAACVIVGDSAALIDVIIAKVLRMQDRFSEIELRWETNWDQCAAWMQCGAGSLFCSLKMQLDIKTTHYIYVHAVSTISLWSRIRLAWAFITRHSNAGGVYLWLWSDKSLCLLLSALLRGTEDDGDEYPERLFHWIILD